jgi:DNA-binding beta-propeller fold protein YncE
VQVLDRRGNFLREWGRSGIAPRAFDNPSAIVIDAKTELLYVVDTMNYRVQVFDRDGELAKKAPDGRPLTNPFGRLGSGNGEFNTPKDLALDRKGNIYVVDAGNNRIQKFDPSGKFLVEWGKFSRRRAVEITTPMSVAYSDEGFGYLYVLNFPDCRVLKYDLEGNLHREWPMHRRGEGAQCGPSRIRIEPRKYTVYIADTENERVLLFDKDGEPLGELAGGKVPFRKPRGVFISDQWGEQAVVADSGNNLIQTFRRER